MKALIIICSIFWMVTYTSRPLISAGMEKHTDRLHQQQKDQDQGQEGETVYTEASLTALVPGPGPVIQVIFQVLFIAPPTLVTRVPESQGSTLMVHSWLYVLFNKISPAKAP